METSGPENSGSVLGQHRASLVEKDSLCMGLHIETAHPLDSGQGTLLCVTTMVRTGRTEG